MVFSCKIIVACALFASLAVLSQAGHLGDHDHVDYYAYPKYNFEYGVTDHHTGDIKNQKEHRDGDKVQGTYSLLESNGHMRTVHYSADKHGGFTAQVYRDGHPVLAPVHAPLYQPTSYVASVGYGHGYSKVDHGSGH